MQAQPPRIVLPLVAALLLGACSSLPSGNATDVPADAIALLPPASLAGWVGGTTHDPEALSSAPADERAALLAGWTAEVAEHWRVEGDELVSDGHGPHLVTVADFGDFELWLEWQLSPAGDSGIYLRGYPQVQLWDPANEAAWGNGSDKGSGGLWNNQTHERFPLVVADRPAGEWNRMRVRMVGERVSVWLNDQLVVAEVVLENYFDRQRPVAARGPLHLQTHGSETRFRNLFVRDL